MKTKIKAWVVSLGVWALPIIVLALPIVIAVASGAPTGTCTSCR